MTDRSSQPAFSPAVPATRGTALSIAFILAAFVTLALAGAWTYLARTHLSRSIGVAEQARLDRVHDVFQLMRTRTQDGLLAQARVLAEDPRLKATLSIEGIDEPTVADILNDLRLLQRSGFALVLSPDGRVFAQAGADELRGLDLSGSTVFQKAKSSNEAVVASWVIGKQVMDLAAMPIRSDRIHVAYLVVGQSVDKAMVTGLAASTGVAIAIGVGSEISVASTEDKQLRNVLTTIAHDVRQQHAQVVDSNGVRYATAFIELEQTQTRPYLVLAHDLAPATQIFELLGWLFWIPAGLVLIALTISRIRSKQLPRIARAGGV